MTYTLGVDLGTQQDYTALVLMRRTEKLRRNGALPGTWQHESEPVYVYSTYDVVRLEQFPLGVDYGTVIERCRQILTNPRLAGATDLVVDATGVGLPVVQQMRHAGLTPYAVTITGGSSLNQTGLAAWNVPKRDLVSSLQLLFQAGRIRLPDPKRNELVGILKEQLQRFTAKITKAGNEVFSAETESVHDDLVMALALAGWFAVKMYPFDEPAPQEDHENTYQALEIIK